MKIEDKIKAINFRRSGNDMLHEFIINDEIINKINTDATMTLEEAKDKSAQNEGYNNWDDLCANVPWEFIDVHTDAASKEYAKAKLEEAKINLVKQLESFGYLSDGYLESALQESITNINLD